MNATDLLLFESAFARDTYQRTIGTPRAWCDACSTASPTPNSSRSRRPKTPPMSLYVGEFRHIKGADLLVDAVARLRADGQPVTLTLGGDGEETAASKRRSPASGSARPCASSATSRRATASPRAVAGGPLPRRFHALCRDRGGGGGNSDDRRQCRRHPRDFRSRYRGVVRVQHAGAMADAIEGALEDPEATPERAKSLRERIFQHFSQKAMVEGVLTGYRDAFANR